MRHDPMMETKTYDFVIVGAGASAMGLVYGLLSPYKDSKPPFTICVVERGSGPPHALTTISPGSWWTASHQSSSNSVQILPSTFHGRVMDVPIGQGLGGTTNIHACLCTPPSADDFLSWPKPWRDDMLESVHQVQDILQSHGALHYSTSSSSSFVLCPSYHQDDDIPIEQTLPWRETCFPSLITSIPLTVKQKQTTKRGHRNDHVMIPRAVLTTTKQVSSCNTGLSLNGVAALAHTRIGTNKYQVIVMDATVFSTIVPDAVVGSFRRDFSYTGCWHVLTVVLNCMSLCLFLAIRIILWLVIAYSPLYYFMRYFIVSVNLVLLNPTSRGKVNVVVVKQRKSLAMTPNAPIRRRNVQIQISLNYLADTRDVDALQEGWEFTNNKCHEWFPNGMELFPSILYRGGGPQHSRDISQQWFHRFANDFCLPYFHWCGTCAMPADNDQHDAVVDSRLRVLQVQSLRVCDASVFPSIISGPTALTCAALGLRFSKLLIEELGTKKFD